MRKEEFDVTPVEWRKRGYYTIFDIPENKVYLFNGVCGGVFVTEINDGEWMQYDNVKKEPWGNLFNFWGDNVKIAMEFMKIIHACYCDDPGIDTCDFCAGLRTPEISSQTS